MESPKHFLGLVHRKFGNRPSYSIKIYDMEEYPISESVYNEWMQILQTNSRAFNVIGKIVAAKAAALNECMN